MTRMRWLPGGTALMLATTAPALAQEDGFSIEGSARARIEFIDGQPRATGAETDAALLLRTTVLAEYRKDGFRIGGEVVDARTYFDSPNSTISTTEANPLEPIQAYVGWRASPDIAVQAGRFTFDLGSRRLVARNNYRNTINGFTGARVDLGPAKGAHATLFWTLPQRRLPSDREGLHDNRVEIDKEGTAQQFFGGFAVLPKTPAGSLELYAFRLAERDAPAFATRNRRLVTIGARIVRAPAPGKIDYDLEGAWQGGTVRGSTSAADTNDLDVSAGFVQGRIAYTFDAPWKPRIGISYDYASGETGASNVSRFDTLFGARVFEFGPTSLYGAVSRANLSSPAARIDVTPGPRWDATLALRGLWLASATDSFGGTAVRDATGQSGRHAGTQVETRVRYWLIPKQLRLSVGGALLGKGRFLRDAPNALPGDTTRYGFIETTLTF